MIDAAFKFHSLVFWGKIEGNHHHWCSWSCHDESPHFLRSGGRAAKRTEEDGDKTPAEGNNTDANDPLKMVTLSKNIISQKCEIKELKRANICIVVSMSTANIRHFQPNCVYWDEVKWYWRDIGGNGMEYSSALNRTGGYKHPRRLQLISAQREVIGVPKNIRDKVAEWIDE